MSAITLKLGRQCQGPQPVASSSSANEPAPPHSTPDKDDDKNLKSKLPNNFYAGESNLDPWAQKIYPKVNENPRAFFSSSSPILLESSIQYPWG